MKHGDKEKGKASKASGKKSIQAGAPGKSSKATGSAQASKKQSSSAQKSSGKAAAGKTGQTETGGNGKARARAGGDSGGFTNPLVAAAFKRAVKKYPNAFRKLSD